MHQTEQPSEDAAREDEPQEDIDQTEFLFYQMQAMMSEDGTRPYERVRNSIDSVGPSSSWNI